MRYVIIVLAALAVAVGCGDADEGEKRDPSEVADQKNEDRARPQSEAEVVNCEADYDDVIHLCDDRIKTYEERCAWYTFDVDGERTAACSCFAAESQREDAEARFCDN